MRYPREKPLDQQAGPGPEIQDPVRLPGPNRRKKPDDRLVQPVRLRYQALPGARDRLEIADRTLVRHGRILFLRNDAFTDAPGE